ncbi:MAG: helix-turn-helix domain-containing protein [Pseudolysinimonas sp.]|uniref:helix-turn-helix domain-containing protein n=1 Tax=Pseudolysinimonas sp. TaxID=2680009 RepID=UPI0032673141
MQVADALSADEWELVTSDAFVPLTCVSFEADFSGHIEHERLDDSTSINHLTTSGIAVDRTARQAAHANADDIHITLTLGGSGVVRQDGRGVRVRAGSVTTYATDRSYQLDYTKPRQRQVLVQVSKRALGIPLDVVERSCEQLLVAPGAATEVLFETIAETRRSPTPGADAGFAQTVRDLAGTMIRSSVSGTRVMPTTRGGLLATVRSFIRGNLRSPELDVAQIAEAHFVSRRFLYELFEPLSETPGEHLRRLRLRRAAELLADPMPSIAQVAERSGFADPTTFTRAFHREFGMLPREFRHS